MFVSSDTFIDYSFEPFLYRLVPFDDIKMSLFMIGNDHVTALFLAKYFAIKFSTGHSFRDIVNPVVKDLKRIVLNSIYPFRKLFYLDRLKILNVLNYRSSLFKYLVYKNFFLYKLLFLNFYLLSFTFFNFYLV